MPVLGVVAVGCAALWVTAVGALRLRGLGRRSGGGPGPVPEAVRVALRAGAGREEPAVLNAAVIELAERGVLRIEPADSTHPALVAPGAGPDADALPAYQAAVVARLRHRQASNTRPVPLTALQPGEDPQARVWHRAFQRQVREEAARLGLQQPALARPWYVLLLLTGIGSSVLVTQAVARYWPSRTAIPWAAFVLLDLLVLAVLGWAARVRMTPAGLAVLAQAAREQRQATGPGLGAQAGIAPAGVTPAGVRVLPNQLQPLPEHQVWSDYGGAWHPIDVDARERYSTRGNSTGAVALTVFALLSLGGATASAHAAHSATSNLTALVVFAGLPILVLAGVLVNLLRRRDLPTRAVLQGQVAKLWSVKRGGEDGGEDFFCTLDVGRAPESVRLQVGRSLYRRLRVGEAIEVSVNPRRRRVRDVRSLGRLG